MSASSKQLSEGRSSFAPAEIDPLWRGCYAIDDTLCRKQVGIPWLQCLIGLLLAAQAFLLQLAFSATPVDHTAVKTILKVGLFGAAVAVLLLLGWPLVRDALRTIRQRRLPVDAALLLALLGLFIHSCYTFFRGFRTFQFGVVIVVLIVYVIARGLALSSRRKALSAIGTLGDFAATARRIDLKNPKQKETVPVAAVRKDDLIHVFAGEVVPVDGRVVKGRALVHEKSYTGAWMPAVRQEGDNVPAGARCEDAALIIQATSAGNARRIDKLTELMDSARRIPTRLQVRVALYVRWFLRFALVAAVGTFAYWTWREDLQTALLHTLALLVVSSPAAAGMAAPLVLWRVLGRLARQGFVFGGANVIERFSHADGVIFDKTGSFGRDQLLLEDLKTPPDPARRAETIALVRAVERRSNHPVARALLTLDPMEREKQIEVLSARALSGRGFVAMVEAPDKSGVKQRKSVRIIRDEEQTGAGQVRLNVEIDNEWAATAIVRERLRHTTEQCMGNLHQMGLRIRVITADGLARAPAITHLADAEDDMTPEAKEFAVRSLRASGEGFARPVLVGDGVSDVAAMKASYAGVALTAGPEVAIANASATLLGTNLNLLSRALRVSREALRVARSNFRWVVLYNVVGVIATATGHIHPVVAVLLMAGSITLVSWQSFYITRKFGGGDPEEAGEPVERTSRKEETLVRPVKSRFVLGLFAALHLCAWAMQGWILGRLLGLVGWQAFVLPAALVIIAAVLLWLWRRMPFWLDTMFSVVGFGGLGVGVGWWTSRGFGAVVTAADPGAHLGPAIPVGWDQWGWIVAGLLLFGVPAMFLVRRRYVRLSLKSWTYGGLIPLGIPAMVVGLTAGLAVACRWSTGWSPAPQVALQYVGMVTGLALGVTAPLAVGYFAPLAWDKGAEEGTVG
jgi:P-type E1-E2 ATPase